MQQRISTWQSFGKRFVTLVLGSAIALFGLFGVAVAPSYAQTSGLTLEEWTSQPLYIALSDEEKRDRAYEDHQKTGLREEIKQDFNYDDLAEEAKNPRKLTEDRYEEDLKAYREDHPSEGIVEKAKEAVENITK